MTDWNKHYALIKRRGQPQEWTALMAKLKREGLLASHIKEIDNAHNAALAAERKQTEHWKQNGLNAVAGLERQLADATQKNLWLVNENLKLQKRLRVYEYEGEEDPLKGHSKTPHGLPNPP